MTFLFIWNFSLLQFSAVQCIITISPLENKCPLLTDKKLAKYYEEERKMKKVIAMLLAVVMLFALCACGSTNSDSKNEASSGIRS